MHNLMPSWTVYQLYWTLVAIAMSGPWVWSPRSLIVWGVSAIYPFVQGRTLMIGIITWSNCPYIRKLVWSLRVLCWEMFFRVRFRMWKILPSDWLNLKGFIWFLIAIIIFRVGSIGHLEESYLWVEIFVVGSEPTDCQSAKANTRSPEVKKMWLIWEWSVHLPVLSTNMRWCMCRNPSWGLTMVGMLI